MIPGFSVRVVLYSDLPVLLFPRPRPFFSVALHALHGAGWDWTVKGETQRSSFDNGGFDESGAARCERTENTVCIGAC